MPSAAFPAECRLPVFLLLLLLLAGSPVASTPMSSHLLRSPGACFAPSRHIIPTGVDVTESEIIFSIEESPEGGYEARALGHPIFTQAESLEELKTMLRDAVTCHFDESSKPRVIRLHMVKDEVISA